MMKKDFRWTASINLAHNKNIITRLSNENFQTEVVMAMPYILEPNRKTNFIPNTEVSKEAILSGVFKAGGSGQQNDIAIC